MKFKQVPLIQFKVIILILIILTSCQKREWNNPFDPECPKVLWTPTDFVSIQQGNAINLSWMQAVKNITGFRLERKIEGETSWKEVISPAKAISTWADSGISGGKLYEYRIVALAGSNESNFVSAQIKPLLTATLTTLNPSSVTSTSAILSGIITSDGGATITERGVCWATTINPTTSSNKLAIGSGTGSFSNSISGLTENTTYYVRAYAINSVGTSYGNEMSFKTSLALSLATLTTTAPSSINTSSATVGGNITSDGNASVTERGICYSTSQYPTTANSKLAIGSGTGNFNISITGLTANTTYYVRAYAINSQGTAYGNQENFAVGGPIDPPPNGGETVTDIDGNIYHTVTIGTQIWMVENLKTTKYNDGTPIPIVTITSFASWYSLNTSACCWYNNDAASNKVTYGALYNWHAVAGSRNIAPKGWHVPTDVEWTTLSTFLGGESLAGNQLKETGTTHWVSSNNGATNSSGFTALPGGSFGSDRGTFDKMGISGCWWSSVEGDASHAWFRGLYLTSFGRYLGYKWEGFSVRCIKD